MKPRVTVLTTVYNGLPYLSEAIESILNQTYTDFEFLIIDDASTDGSQECINSFTDPRIRVSKNEKNIGQVPSLNKGLQLARGKYIARLDQDDVSLPNRLEEQIGFLEEHLDISIICSWEHSIDSDGRKVRDWKSVLKNYGDFLGTILIGKCPVWHPSVMFKKEVVMKLDGFDTSYAPAEDYELWKRIALKRHNAAIVPRFHLLQRLHNRRLSILQGDRQADHAERAHNETISKFSPHQDVNCLAALLRLEKDPCGREYDRKHMREIICALYEMISNVRDKQNLSNNELKSLKNIVYRRLGLGVRYGGVLTRLPSVMFYLLFFGLSPLLIPKVRIALSGFYNKLHEFRYKVNLFRH
jgi:glycosyltransferase involved in cell wall biosynthesis